MYNAYEYIDITSNFYRKFRRLVSRVRPTPRGSNRRSGPRYNANKRRRNGRGEGAEERAITCDQYARLRSADRVSRVEQSTSAAPLRSHPVASTRYYARSEFRVPPRLHVHYTRDAFTGVSRESDANGTTAVAAEGNGSVRPSPTSSPFFLFFLSEWKHRWHPFVPLVPVVRAVSNSRVHTARVSGSLLGRRTKCTDRNEETRTDEQNEETSRNAPVRDDSRFRFQKLASTKCKPIAVWERSGQTRERAFYR